jgi:hypothetical protein
VEQTDIVMLLTPRIVRTQELTMADVSPIFIGTQNNISLGGPPPLIAPPDAPAAPVEPGVQPDVAPAAAPGDAPGAAAAPAPPAPAPSVPPAGSGAPVVPPGSSQIPGTTTLPAGGAEPSPAATPTVTGGAQFVVTPPGTDFRVGGGPYTVAVSATNAARLSAVTLTLTYNPAALRVRTVQEGSLMRAGGVMATFTQQVDAATGRIDIAIVRTGDTTGVAGTGLLAAILFDAVGGGPASLNLAGTASAPGGAPLPVETVPVPAVTVR